MTPKEALHLLDRTLVCRENPEHPGEADWRTCCWLGDDWYNWARCYGSAELLHVLLEDGGAQLVGWDEDENPSQTLFAPDEWNCGHTFVIMPDGTIIDWWINRFEKRGPAIVPPTSRFRKLYGTDFGKVGNSTKRQRFGKDVRSLRERLLKRLPCPPYAF